MIQASEQANNRERKGTLFLKNDNNEIIFIHNSFLEIIYLINFLASLSIKDINRFSVKLMQKIHIAFVKNLVAS